MIRMKQINLIYNMGLYLLVLSLFWGCNESGTLNPVIHNEQDITILNPKASEDYFYSSFKAIDIIYRFNPKTIKIPAMFYYSTDNKKNWDPIKVDGHHKIDRQYNDSKVKHQDESFDYATFKWTPENNSLSQVFIHIKATGYDPDVDDDIDIIGPVEID